MLHALQYVMCLKDLFWGHFFLHYTRSTLAKLFDRMVLNIIRTLTTIRRMRLVLVIHQTPWSFEKNAGVHRLDPKVDCMQSFDAKLKKV